MSLSGRCACGEIRYTLTQDPMIVNACHCRDCQRLTGSAFAINMWIENKFVEKSGNAPQSFMLKGGSGTNHEVFFCGKCGTYVWSRYHGAPGDALFVRAGTLENPDAVTPDFHVFTRSKLPWITLPAGAKAFETFYDLPKTWPPASLERLQKLIAEK